MQRILLLGWNIEQFIYFGGYPGAAALVEDEFRWKSYVLDAIVEPTLSRNVLQLARIDKPALLRFAAQYADSTALVAGSGGIPLETFLTTPLDVWLSQ
ncbi:MAG: hypothetical protein EPN21_11455 [Methylococcaceae bacterium]|nr:MAG: hypothetical protein EPN21_11455 [Methylococcaceae bacterium]